jgi:CRP-like cAMP-binding protein
MDPFRHLNDAERGRLLELAEERTFPSGSLLIEEGAPAGGVFLILEGRVRIEKAHLGARVPVDELDAGELVGEVSYLLDSSATATVVADGDVRVAAIAKPALDRLVATDAPLAAKVFRSWAGLLAARLDRRTGDVVGVYWSWG